MNRVYALENAIADKADYLEAWFSLGTALGKVQRYDEAIAAYDKATGLKPDFYLAWFGKARVYAAQNELDLALDNLRQAIDLNPDKCREVARTDSVFEGLRSEAAFKQLVEIG